MLVSQISHSGPWGCVGGDLRRSSALDSNSGLPCEERAEVGACVKLERRKIDPDISGCAPPKRRVITSVSSWLSRSDDPFNSCWIEQRTRCCTRILCCIKMCCEFSCTKLVGCRSVTDRRAGSFAAPLRRDSVVRSLPGGLVIFRSFFAAQNGLKHFISMTCNLNGLRPRIPQLAPRRPSQDGIRIRPSGLRLVHFMLYT